MIRQKYTLTFDGKTVKIYTETLNKPVILSIMTRLKDTRYTWDGKTFNYKMTRHFIIWDGKKIHKNIFK